jgi:hypothetical protein
LRHGAIPKARPSPSSALLQPLVWANSSSPRGSGSSENGQAWISGRA